MTRYKQPVSVLVVIHTKAMRMLLLERAANPGYWQSVTGSLEEGETPVETARREVQEETGVTAPLHDFRDWRITNTFEIQSVWRHRYAPDVTRNAEHLYSLEVENEQPVCLSPQEHTDYRWLDWEEAARQCFSWTNRDAIRLIVAGSR